MKKLVRNPSRNSISKKKQVQVATSPRYSSKKLKNKNDFQLPSIISPTSPNTYKLRKKSVRLKENLNISNPYVHAKSTKQDYLQQIRNKLQFVTKRSQNIKSKYSKSGCNLNKYLNYDIKLLERADKLNLSNQCEVNQNTCEESKVRQSHIRSKTKIQTKPRAQSVQQTQDGIYKHIKNLFNHIQNRLKTTKNDHFSAKSVDQSLYAQSYKQLITCSQFNLSRISKSVLTSPRLEIFQSKQKKNKCNGAMIANLGHQIEKLQLLEIKNQDSLKMFINQQIGLLNLQFYKERLKDKGKL